MPAKSMRTPGNRNPQNIGIVILCSILAIFGAAGLAVGTIADCSQLNESVNIFSIACAFMSCALLLFARKCAWCALTVLCVLSLCIMLLIVYRPTALTEYARSIRSCDGHP